MTAETTSPVEAGTVHDQQTPIQLIAGRVSDALRLKLQRCVEFLPEVLMDIGLMNWEEFSHFGYESQPVERSSLLIYEDIAAGVADMKKPESQCKLSHSQADMLAKATRAVARGYNGMPEEPKSPGTSQGKGHIGSPYSKSDSQLSHDTARLTAFSHLRCTEKLETVNGPSKPAHIYDIMAFVDETTKTLVGMDGYGPMQAQLELRKTNPALTHEEFVDNSEVPEDIWKQQSRLAYQGIPSQYKRDVISKSRFAKMLFDPGILIYVLYETALDISDRDATRRKLAYQETHPVRPNDRPSMEKAHRAFERGSFELLQLRELGSAKTSPSKMQYNAGAILYSNYSDLSQEWARMWKEGDQSMEHMSNMMQTVSEIIGQLPDIRPYRGLEFQQGIARTATPPLPAASSEIHRHVCRQFARNGSCTYGDRCKFSHSQAVVNMAQVHPTDEQVIKLQGTMNEVYNVTVDTDASDPISKGNFALTYDTAFSAVGTEDFEQTNDYLAMMVQEERAASNDQRSIDDWHL